MKRLLASQITRALLNKRWVLVFLLAALSFTYGHAQLAPSLGDSPLGALTIWQLILLRGYYGFFAALMAALPFADSFSREKREGLLTSILLRADYRSYLFAKFLAIALSGIAAVLLPALLLLAVCLIAYPSGPIQLPDLCFYLPLNRNLIPAAACSNPVPGSYLLLSLVFLGLFGSTYAALAMAASLVSKHSTPVFATPILLYAFGYYILPASIRLNWLISTEAALIPAGNLFAALVQYLVAVLLTGFAWLAFGKKERQVLS